MAESAPNARNFAFVVQMLRAECGLILDPGKEYLVVSRLTPLVRKHSVRSVDDLIDRLRDAPEEGLVREVVEAMVTTETSFFRDVHPFETLRRSVLPDLIARRRPARRLNIWCAASASGQEPYSLAILLHEHFPELLNWQVHFIASDVSEGMLRRARTGCYSQVEVNRGLPTPLLLKWFEQAGATWRIADRLRQSIQFVPLNLTRPWPTMPAWDLVCLRNIMIYFEEETKRSILERLTRTLAPDGYLLLGGAETTYGLSDAYLRIDGLPSSFYRRKLP